MPRPLYAISNAAFNHVSYEGLNFLIIGGFEHLTHLVLSKFGLR